LHDRKIVYVVRDDPQAAGFAIGRATSTDRYLAPMKIGVSDSCDSPASLSRAYSHAAFALSLGDNPAGPSFYGELGVFRLLAEIGDRSVLERYQEETLGKLSVLDGDKRADYLKTLRLYLENDGSVAETALENYTHRNTVNYRIRKIRDILGVDLNDADTRYRLRTVLYIREFLDKTRE
jgi:DNA-binding PucR family transcriptional regulator